jgi:hypothetical protein
MSAHVLSPSRRELLAVLFGTAAASVLPLPAWAQTNGVKESYNATAINMGTGPAGMARVLITVDRWTTAAERERLLKVLLDKGPEKLLDAVQDNQKVGFIRLPNTLAWDLHYALQMPLPEGGRRVVLITDRPISFNEARNQNRTMDYPFTLVEIRFDKEGVGVGKMSVYTKIAVSKDKQTVELENYGTEPTRLTEVRIEK